ncbi:MAG: hypothetical protein AB2598_18660 [Candidatus Thiodiazotropha sp.]
MNANSLKILLIVSILVSASVGAGSSYYHNQIFIASHKTTYSLDEELSIYDQIIEKVEKNEINEPSLIKVFESEREKRISAHKVMESSERATSKVFLALGLIVILQMYLIYLLVNKFNEHNTSHNK